MISSTGITIHVASRYDVHFFTSNNNAHALWQNTVLNGRKGLTAAL